MDSTFLDILKAFGDLEVDHSSLRWRVLIRRKAGFFLEGRGHRLARLSQGYQETGALV
jgi:hypothetical protein